MAWVYTPGSILGQSGIAVTISSNIADIAGEPRPGQDGFYSIGAHEQQYTTTNIGAATYGKFILDAGAVYMNFVSQDEPGTLLGATRGGSTFTIGQEIINLEVDGALGPVKGGRRLVRVNTKLVCNFIEHSADLWQYALPGSEYSADFATTISPVDDYHVEFRRSLEIALTDYIDNIVIVAQMSGDDNVVICGVKNALVDANFEMGTEDNNESGLTVTFTGHFDINNLNDEPWILFYPSNLI